MDVAIDEPRNDELAGAVDHAGSGGRFGIRTDAADLSVNADDVGNGVGARLDVQDAGVADHQGSAAGRLVSVGPGC